MENMSINDIMEDLKSDIQATQDQINETMDEESRVRLEKNMDNYKQELYNIFGIIDHGK